MARATGESTVACRRESGHRRPASAVTLPSLHGRPLVEPSRDTAGAEDGVHRWLARELHDEVISRLTLVLLDMEELRRELPDPTVAGRVAGFQAAVREALSSLRGLLVDLRDESGEDDRLVDDVTVCLDLLTGRSGIAGELRVSPTWPQSLSAHIALNLRRIMEEALRNVALHSGAQRVEVSLDADDRELTVTVKDDGRGCQWPGAASRAGFGLLGMQERAVILGGRVEVTSLPGSGTTVQGTFSPASQSAAAS